MQERHQREHQRVHVVRGPVDRPVRHLAHGPPLLLRVDVGEHRVIRIAELHRGLASVAAHERDDLGLQETFKSVFPIEDFAGRSILEFVSYDLEAPKYDKSYNLSRH